MVSIYMVNIRILKATYNTRAGSDKMWVADDVSLFTANGTLLELRSVVGLTTMGT